MKLEQHCWIFLLYLYTLCVSQFTVLQLKEIIKFYKKKFQSESGDYPNFLRGTGLYLYLQYKYIYFLFFIFLFLFLFLLLVGVM